MTRSTGRHWVGLLGLMVFLWTVPGLVHGQDTSQWYRSNGLFQQLEALSGPRGQGYELEILRSSARRSRSFRLYLDGSLVERREDQLSGGGALLVRDHYVNGRVELQERFDLRGLLVREIRRDDQGAFLEQVDYEYDSGNRLIQVTALGPEGEVLRQRSYGYTRDGRIRTIEQQLGQGDQLQVNRSRFRYRSSILVEEALEIGESQRIRLIFDDSGALTEKIVYQDGQLISQERYDGSGSDGRSGQSIETFPDQNLRIERQLDSQGRVVVERYYPLEGGGEAQREISYQYDGTSLRVTYQRDQRGSLVEETSYSYDGEGDLLSKELVENGELNLRSQYRDDERIDSLYLFGQVILKVYYQDGIRVAEEEFRDGELIDRREFSNQGDEQ